MLAPDEDFIHLDNAEQCTGLCASVIPQQWVAELKRGRSN